MADMEHSRISSVAVSGVAALACIVLATATTACGDDDDAATSAPVVEPTTPPTTVPTTAVPVTQPSVVDNGWRQEAAAVCAAYEEAGKTLPTPPAASVGEVVTALRSLLHGMPSLDSVALPADLRADIDAVGAQMDALLDETDRVAANGWTDATISALDHYQALVGFVGGLLTVNGAACGDPARAANASLNVPLPGIAQVSTGLGSVWANPSQWGTSIDRIDPSTGAVVASIDVGATPIKSQPADGRMIVRTANSFVAIDPATNTVTGVLPKSDVGPAANRAWAVDGAMWICDSQRLHRFDPATLSATGTVIELGIDCGQIYATTDLVVAWNYNQDAGESGASAAVFIDPATNRVLATTSLPMDAGVPVVLDDAVFFPGHSFRPDNAGNAVVDRATWTVVATPDYGRTIAQSQAGFDGQSIYLVADFTDVLVIDAKSYELADTIEPLNGGGKLNSLAIGPGALWVATGNNGYLQRFELDDGRSRRRDLRPAVLPVGHVVAGNRPDPVALAVS